MSSFGNSINMDTIKKESINKNDQFSEKLHTTETDMMFQMLANKDKMVEKSKQKFFDKEDNESSSSSSSRSHHEHHREKSDKSDSEKSNHNFANVPFMNPSSYTVPIKEPQSKEEIENDEYMIKLDMLRKLGELTQKGVKLGRDYSLNDKYETMKFEFDLHSGIRAKKNMVDWMSRGMVHLMYGIEFLNDTYDPFGFHLDGWSESVSDDIENYYDVFGELYEKYNQPGKNIAPEIKLLMLISGSAISHHVKYTYFLNSKTAKREKS